MEESECGVRRTGGVSSKKQICTDAENCLNEWVGWEASGAGRCPVWCPGLVVGVGKQPLAKPPRNQG